MLLEEAFLFGITRHTGAARLVGNPSSSPGILKKSGNNLFMSAYHGFAQLGDEHTPVPAAFEDFPVFVVEYSDVKVPVSRRSFSSISM